jgi:sugar phosphate isomerase/epimerase
MNPIAHSCPFSLPWRTRLTIYLANPEKTQGVEMTGNAKPLLGAALMMRSLPEFIDWLQEGQRDLEIQDVSMPDGLDGDLQALARECRSMLDGYPGRMGIHGPFYSLDIMAIDSKIRQATTGRLLEGVDFAQAIGATHMVIHSPYRTFGHHFASWSAADYEAEALQAIHATLEPVLAQASQAGCVLVMECIADLNPYPLINCVKSFESDFLQVSVDVGHAYMAQVYGGASPDQWIRDAGLRLGHIHLQDTDGILDRHWATGDGNLNWRAIFEAIAYTGAAPRLLLEMRDEEDIWKSVEYLQQKGWAI